jgi:hypothetical protein
MNPPIEASSLDGKAVLLLLLSRKDPSEQYLFRGLAHWTGSGIEVRSEDGNDAVSVPLVHAEKSSFEPNVLPHLVADPQDTSLALGMAEGATYCIPTFLTQVPQGAIRTPRLIGGLATGREDEIFLMQVR